MTDPQPPPLSISVVTAAIAEVGSALRREALRLALGWVAAVAGLAIVLTIGISLAIAGVARLSYAVSHACGMWLGKSYAGDALAGLILLALPLVAVLLLYRAASSRSRSP